MPTSFALMLLALLDTTPRLAEAQPQGGELSPREEFMVMVGVGSGYMSALCNLEKDGFISTATRAKLANEQLAVIGGDPSTKDDLEGVLAGMKGVEEDKKNFFKVPRIQGTIPHPITGEASAGVVLLRPAAPGTGVIAGGPVRAVLECAGIHDILSKSMGSDNAINVVHATVAALRGHERPEEVAARRGLPLEDVAPAALLRARAAGMSWRPVWAAITTSNISAIATTWSGIPRTSPITS